MIIIHWIYAVCVMCFHLTVSSFWSNCSLKSMYSKYFEKTVQFSKRICKWHSLLRLVQADLAKHCFACVYVHKWIWHSCSFSFRQCVRIYLRHTTLRKILFCDDKIVKYFTSISRTQKFELCNVFQQFVFMFVCSSLLIPNFLTV